MVTKHFSSLFQVFLLLVNLSQNAAAVDAGMLMILWMSGGLGASGCGWL
jgi:hypothetical protein